MARQAKQAELISKMAEVLFDNSEDIPNGAYVLLMNIARDLSRVPPPPPPVVVPETITPPCWLPFLTKYSIADKEHPALNDIFTTPRMSFEVLSEDPKTRVFYKVQKVNVMSIIVDRWEYRPVWTDETRTMCRFVRNISHNQKQHIIHLKNIWVRDNGGTTAFNGFRNIIPNEYTFHPEQLPLWGFQRKYVVGWGEVHF